MKLVLERAPHNILVPVNGSRADDTAVRMACGLARQAKGKVYLLHVVEVERNLPIDAAPEPDVVHGETVLEELEAVCREERCPAQADILHAREAGPAIVEEAISRQAGLVIMGLTIHRHRGEYGIGATVPYVLMRAHCPVWVTRAELSVSAQAFKEAA